MYNFPTIGNPAQNFQTLYATLVNANMAMQGQDLTKVEDILVWSRNFYNNLSTSLYGDQVVPFQIVLNLIDMAARNVRINEYQNDERFKKAAEELTSAKKTSDDTNILFAKLPRDFIAQLGFNNFLPLLKFMANFHECTFASRIGFVQGALDKSDGKFIDEVRVLRMAATEMRRLQEKPFGPFYNQQDNYYAMQMIGWMNKSAAYYEKLADRMEEKRKDIEFVQPFDRRVFIVHGHNHVILDELKAMLKEQFKLDPIVLIDAQDNGGTLIEKFEHYGRLCAFAFVIVTPDDWVGNKKDKNFQARPNVLFELGWFCGRYGRSRVRILKERNTPLPSDLNGIVAIEFDEKLADVVGMIKADLEFVGILEKSALSQG